MKKTFIIVSSLFLTVILTMSLAVAAFADTGTKFPDVEKDAWYTDSVAYVTENNLMSGYGNGNFGPKDSLKREQFATIINNMMYSPQPTAVSDMQDIVKDAWYAKPVSWCIENKIVSGYSSTRFGVGDNITREQLVTILWNFAKYLGIDVATEKDNLNGFSDKSKVSGYALPAMNWAVENGIVSGKQGGKILDPRGKATRAECAAIIKGFVEKNICKHSIEYIEKVEATIAEEGMKAHYKCDKCGRYFEDADGKKVISNVKSLVIPKVTEISFGAYEQDNNTSNGKEAIEWNVLAVKDGKALLISKDLLDCKRYNEDYVSVTWDKCTLRSWLNNDFLNAAFSADEQSKIVDSKVTADANPIFDTAQGNDTTDKVFILSATEVNNYIKSVENKMCAPTEYAKARGANPSNIYYIDGGRYTCWWWLRTSGDKSDKAAAVSCDGTVVCGGQGVWAPGTCIRPALWISLEDSNQGGRINVLQ